MILGHHPPRSVEDQAVIDEFFYVVNMPIASLDRWLHTPESQAAAAWQAGLPGGAGECCSGRRVSELLHKSSSAYTAEDIEDMRKVVRNVHRQLADRPHGDVHNSPWRHALMNCGHDPLTGRHHF